MAFCFFYGSNHVQQYPREITMSNQSAHSTVHLSHLEALLSRHRQVQDQIDEGLKHPPSTELESFIKSKKLEKLKLKEEIEKERRKSAA